MSFGFRMRQALGRVESSLSPYTKLLLHMDGIASTPAAPVDEAGAIAVVGANAELSTTQFKFGTRSLKGGSDFKYIYFPGDAKYDPGSGPFTLEFFMYYVSPSSQMFINVDGAGSSPSDLKGLTFRLFPGGLYYYIAGADIGDTDVSLLHPIAGLTGWHHFCFERVGNVFSFYLDGIYSSQQTRSGAITFGGTYPPRFAVGICAGDLLTWPSQNYIDEVRYTVGTAVYNAGASNFTPPSSPFTL